MTIESWLKESLLIKSKEGENTIGTLALVEVMGDEGTIVDAARVSFNSSKANHSTEHNNRLLRYLIRHNHTTPLEMCEVRFLISAPLFVVRQWVRHRTASINEISARYSVLGREEFCFLPSVERFKYQDTVNRQQSSPNRIPESKAKEFRDRMKVCIDNTFKLYYEMIEYGVAREVARMILPVNTYTKFYWKIDLKNLLHFVKLRISDDSQEEIQQYAKEIYLLLSIWLPNVMEMWAEHNNIEHKPFAS